MRHPTSKRVLAIASGGGHWVQLLRLRPAFDGHTVLYVTTIAGYRTNVPNDKFRVVRDGSRWSKKDLLVMAMQILWILLRFRPHVIVTTGAAPGFFAIRFGKLLRAKTLWIDSIANAQELSLTGMKTGPHSDGWLTQWPELACENGPHYRGAVL